MADRRTSLTNGSIHRPAGAAATPNRDQVPQSPAKRRRLLEAVRRYVASVRPVPPFSIEELVLHSGRMLAETGSGEKYRKWIAVLISNEAWRDQVAAVPFERRLLLLPKCLRNESECQGQFDTVGLLCAACGRCSICDLKAEAEALGYVVLVAEGTPAVMTLLQSGSIEAVMGISCLSALESIYPLMEAAAVPGIAIPLLYDGCSSTAVDMDWVREFLGLQGAAPPRMDIDALRSQVDSWFTSEALEEIMGPSGGQTELIARQWLARHGKRWRPLLAVAAQEALSGRLGEPPTPVIRRIALAVECFHKASLIHDDIEDGDDLRYGEWTLHHEFGVPVALNVGDFLIGEGYRLIGEPGCSAAQVAEMLRIAAAGHRELSVGQGAELCWARNPQPLSVAEVIDIFKRKTAPAFEVALRMGAVAAGTRDGLVGVFHGYSQALGVAYQIHDDLEDLDGGGEPGDASALRPSILLAIAYERAGGVMRDFLDAAWRRSADADPETLRRIVAELGADDEARRLMSQSEEDAMRCLEPLASTDLKALLRRAVSRIFQPSTGG